MLAAAVLYLAVGWVTVPSVATMGGVGSTRASPPCHPSPCPWHPPFCLCLRAELMQTSCSLPETATSAADSSTCPTSGGRATTSRRLGPALAAPRPLHPAEAQRCCRLRVAPTACRSGVWLSEVLLSAPWLFMTWPLPLRPFFMCSAWSVCCHTAASLSSPLTHLLDLVTATGMQVHYLERPTSNYLQVRSLRCCGGCMPLHCGNVSAHLKPALAAGGSPPAPSADFGQAGPQSFPR